MVTPVKIQSAPGIKRDGTQLEGDHYVDGNWCRFQRGLPRKMLGYTAVTENLTELTRGMTSFSFDGLQYLHLGSESFVNQVRVNNSGLFSGLFDRTPAVSFLPNADYLWQFDHFYDMVAVTTEVVAHPGINLTDIASQTEIQIFIGDVSASSVLVDSTLPNVSGGIVTLGPYLFSFGNSGRIGWSVVNDPTTLDAEAFITQQKIVRGIPLRGAGQGPAGMFWSLDALIRATFVGGAAVWQFDTLASDISILSSQGVVEYDGSYYWPGVDRFMMFNGVVRDLQNPFNDNWFYDNLNFEQRQKVFGFKVPRYGEIWWCYPRGAAEECTHAVILNVKEGYWYDTQLPDGGRTAGIYAKVYNRPFMSDLDVASTGGFTLWQHETGVDKVTNIDSVAIASHFETAEISMLTAEQGTDESLRVARVEPDFVQSGALTLTVKGRANSRAPVQDSGVFTFQETAATGTDETVKLREVRRLMSFRFDSNTTGGDYEMGECMAHVEPADGRIES